MRDVGSMTPIAAFLGRRYLNLMARAGITSSTAFTRGISYTLDIYHNIPVDYSLKPLNVCLAASSPELYTLQLRSID